MTIKNCIEWAKQKFEEYGNDFFVGGIHWSYASSELGMSDEDAQLFAEECESPEYQKKFPQHFTQEAQERFYLWYYIYTKLTWYLKAQQ